MSTTLNAVGVVRRLTQKDFPQLLAIERKVFDVPWTEAELTKHLEQRNVFGRVIEIGGELGGYAIYDMAHGHIHLDSIAIHPSLQRMGYGRRLISELKESLTKVVRPRILTDVRETNLKAQCFLRANGFRAINIIRNYYEVAGHSEDSYLFVYNMEGRSL